MTRIHFAALVALVVATLSGCSQVAGLSDAQKAEGFVDTKAGVAYKWLPQPPGGMSCGGETYCLGVQIVALRDCSAVYAEMNVLNSSNVAIDVSRASAGALRAGGRAELKFGTSAEGASRGSFTKVTCS